MSSVPIPGPGSIVIARNMREARQKGMSRNMATASTYHWFYQKVRSGGRRVAQGQLNQNGERGTRSRLTVTT